MHLLLTRLWLYMSHKVNRNPHHKAHHKVNRNPHHKVDPYINIKQKTIYLLLSKKIVSTNRNLGALVQNPWLMPGRKTRS